MVLLSIHNFLLDLMVIFILAALLYYLVKLNIRYEKETKYRIFLQKYGKFIGKKGFILSSTRGFYDENKKPVAELRDCFSGNEGAPSTFIPCTITDCQTHLGIEPKKIEAHFQIVYVGVDCVVLNNPVFGDTVLMKGTQIIEPYVGQTVRLQLRSEKKFSTGWKFKWWFMPSD